MNICIVTEYFPKSLDADITGGVEARAFHVAAHLCKHHNVTILTSWRKGLARKQQFGKYSVIRVGPHHAYSNTAGFISRMQFAKAVHQTSLKVDLIDAYNFTSYVPAYYLAKKLRVPCIATYHESWIGNWYAHKGISGLPYEVYERLLLRLPFNHIIAVSNVTKNTLHRHGVACPISVVHNGINFQQLQQMKVKKNPYQICYVGRLIETKHVDDLLYALALVKKEFPQLMCHVVGMGTSLSKLQELAKKLQVPVQFHGHIKKHSDVVKIIAASQLLCHPSTVEGFGIVLIEAMGVGTPVVCSNIDVFKEVTHNGQGSLLFTPGNTKELAKQIIALLQDSALYKKKSTEASRLAKTYDWQSITQQINKVYEQVRFL